jgi:hypothetical protein
LQIILDDLNFFATKIGFLNALLFSNVRDNGLKLIQRKTAEK